MKPRNKFSFDIPRLVRSCTPGQATREMLAC